MFIDNWTYLLQTFLVLVNGNKDSSLGFDAIMSCCLILFHVLPECLHLFSLVENYVDILPVSQSLKFLVKIFSQRGKIFSRNISLKFFLVLGIFLFFICKSHTAIGYAFVKVV